MIVSFFLLLDPCQQHFSHLNKNLCFLPAIAIFLFSPKEPAILDVYCLHFLTLPPTSHLTNLTSASSTPLKLHVQMSPTTSLFQSLVDFFKPYFIWLVISLQHLPPLASEILWCTTNCDYLTFLDTSSQWPLQSHSPLPDPQTWVLLGDLFSALSSFYSTCAPWAGPIKRSTGVAAICKARQTTTSLFPV